MRQELRRAQAAHEVVLRSASKEANHARKRGAKEGELQEIWMGYQVDLDLTREEADEARTRWYYAKAKRYDLEIPGPSEQPELWEEMCYLRGMYLNAKGRAHVRSLIRAEQKQNRDEVEFWIKNILAPLMGWIVAILLVLLKK